jgi:hypothetical protein
MKPMGGFFELEIPTRGSGLHGSASALASGRSCLAQALETLRPRRALVPFYTCEALLEPLAERGVVVDYYALTPALEPDLGRGPSDGECLIYINYFGLKSELAARLAADHGPRAIIDNTQAFFEAGYDGAWSFNSARKFFGVPDGGYLYAPRGDRWSYPPNQEIRIEHLVSRLMGRNDVAFAQYRESESKITSGLLGMSTLTERLLRGIDYKTVASSRQRNFRRLHTRLGRRNLLPQDLLLPVGHVPFCYPFLPETQIEPGLLWEAGIFVPRIWPDVMRREGRGFVAERALATRLLVLPIDHRYRGDDMERLAAVVLEVLG